MSDVEDALEALKQALEQCERCAKRIRSLTVPTYLKGTCGTCKSWDRMTKVCAKNNGYMHPSEACKEWKHV